MSENNDLSFEQVDALLAYDPETGVLRWKVSRRGTAKAGGVAGCLDSGEGYLRVRVHGKRYQAHRLAWLLSTGSWPSQQLDHINGQKTDNRIANLRECSNAQNMQNQGKSSRNSSGVQGVSWDKRDKKWRSYICVNGTQIHIGLFETLEAAATARAEAKQQYHKFQPVERDQCELT